jgi:hypothetical protein
MLFRSTVVAAVIVSLTACTTMRAVEDVTPQGLRDRVEAGDEVRIVTAKGAVYELEVTKVEDDALTGRAGNGKLYKVRYAAIQALEVRERSEGQTRGAVAGGLILAYAVAIAFMLMIARALVPGDDDDN